METYSIHTVYVITYWYCIMLTYWLQPGTIFSKICVIMNLLFFVFIL